MITARTSHRLGLVVATGTALVLLFGVAALGVVGDGGPADLLYVAAVAVAVVGSAAARLRAPGTALALAAAALVVVLAGVVAFAAGLAEDASAGDVVMLTAGFAGGFGLAAWLVRRAAGRPPGLV